MANVRKKYVSTSKEDPIFHYLVWLRNLSSRCRPPPPFQNYVGIRANNLFSSAISKFVWFCIKRKIKTQYEWNFRVIVRCIILKSVLRSGSDGLRSAAYRGIIDSKSVGLGRM